MGIGLGVIMGDIEVGANMDLKNEYTGGDNKSDTWKGSGMNLTAKYGMGGWAFHGSYDKDSGEYTNYTGTVADAVDKWEASEIMVGAAHTSEVSSSARVIADVSYQMVSAKTTDATTGVAIDDVKESKWSGLPVTVAFEADAASWLTLRGHVTQTMFMNNAEFTHASTTITQGDNDDEGTISSTMWGMGATLNFGKLKLDGIIGNGGTADDLNTDTLMSKVSAHYWF
jgi:hypothetical protein